MIQWDGSEDPDPYNNVTNSKHWKKNPAEAEIISRGGRLLATRGGSVTKDQIQTQSSIFPGVLGIPRHGGVKTYEKQRRHWVN